MNKQKGEFCGLNLFHLFCACVCFFVSFFLSFFAVFGWLNG